MKTIIYIDGFNLYYGSLKGSKYKWLDLNILFKELLQPHHQIASIKYFTANVSARDGNDGAPIRQQAYLQALESHIPHVQVHRGHFMSQTVSMRLTTPIGKQRYAEVIKTEEKGSDVNLAIQLLNDAWLDAYECAVVVSNDSDLSEALRIVKTKLKKRIILVTPGDPTVRPPTNQLKRYSNATLSLAPELLGASQLPSPIPGTTLRKPGTW